MPIRLAMREQGRPLPQLHHSVNTGASEVSSKIRKPKRTLHTLTLYVLCVQQRKVVLPFRPPHQQARKNDTPHKTRKYHLKHSRMHAHSQMNMMNELSYCLALHRLTLVNTDPRTHRHQHTQTDIHTRAHPPDIRTNRHQRTQTQHTHTRAHPPASSSCPLH